jgi:hypothetical protein
MVCTQSSSLISLIFQYLSINLRLIAIQLFVLLKSSFLLKLVVREQIAEGTFASLPGIFLSRHIAQIGIVSKILVAIINPNRSASIYISKKKPFTSEHKTPNLIILNGYYTRMKLKAPQCQRIILKNTYFTS